MMTQGKLFRSLWFYLLIASAPFLISFGPSSSAAEGKTSKSRVGLATASALVNVRQLDDIVGPVTDTTLVADLRSRLYDIDGSLLEEYEGEIRGATLNGGIITTPDSGTQSYLYLYDKAPIALEGTFIGITADDNSIVTSAYGQSWLYDLQGHEQAALEGIVDKLIPGLPGLITYQYNQQQNHYKHRLYSANGTLLTILEGYFLGLTPDGQQLITASESNSYLYNVDGSLKAVLEGIPRPFIPLEGYFTPDGRGIVTVLNGDTVQTENGDANRNPKSFLYGLDGTFQQQFEGTFQAFTPDQQGLITSTNSSDSSISRIYSMDGTERAVVQGNFDSFSPNEQLFTTFVFEPDRGSRLYDLTGQQRADLLGEVTDWSPNGERFVSYLGGFLNGESINQYRLYDSNGVEQAILEGWFDRFTPDGKRLLTSMDETSWVYDINTYEAVSVKGDFISLTPNGQQFITRLAVNGGTQISLYDFDGTEQATFEDDFSGFTPDGKGLITYVQSSDQSRLFHLDGTEQMIFEGRLRDFHPNQTALIAYAYTRDQTRLYDFDGTEQAVFEGNIWNFEPDSDLLIATSDRPPALDGMQAPVTASLEGLFQTFTPDQTGFITVHKQTSKTLLYNLDGTLRFSASGVFESFTPSGEGMVLFSSADNQSRSYDLNGIEQTTFEGRFMAFTPDSQGIITGPENVLAEGPVRWFDLEGNKLREFEGVFKAFTPEGQGIVLYSPWTSTLYSLDGVEQATFEGEFITFSPDEQGLLTSSSKNLEPKTRFYSLDGTLRATFEGLFNDIEGLFFDVDESLLEFSNWSADGDKFITTMWGGYGSRLYGLDGTLYSSYDGPSTFIEAGESIVSSSLTDDLIRRDRVDGTRQETFQGYLPILTPDGEGLVTALVRPSQDSQLYSLDGVEQASFKGRFLAFTPDGQGLITHVKFGGWDDPGQSLLYSFDGGLHLIFEGQFVAFMPDQQGLITVVKNVSPSQDVFSRLYRFDGTPFQ